MAKKLTYRSNPADYNTPEEIAEIVQDVLMRIPSYGNYDEYNALGRKLRDCMEHHVDANETLHLLACRCRYTPVLAAHMLDSKIYKIFTQDIACEIKENSIAMLASLVSFSK
jgi:hypothetical protein